MEMLMMVIHNGELMNHSDDVDLMIEWQVNIRNKKILTIKMVRNGEVNLINIVINLTPR